MIAFILSKFATIEFEFMAEQFSIYYRGRKLVITNNIDPLEVAESGAQIHEDVKVKDAPKILQLFLSEQNLYDIFMQCFKPSKAMLAMLGDMCVVEAAGGLVRNELGHNLLIYRNGFWDLPKGKIEPGESRKLAAMREVSEETGLKDPQIGPLITSTHHIYKQGNQKFLKRTHWYAMSCNGPQTLTPQTEEGIEQVCWKSDAEMQPIICNLYRNIAEVYRKAQALLPQWHTIENA